MITLNKHFTKAKVMRVLKTPKTLIVVGALLLAVQPILSIFTNDAQAAANPALSLTGSIWENEDGSGPDTVSQLAAGDGTIEAPWGGRVNLRAQLKNTGDALSGTDVGLFYDKGDGLWSKVNSSDKKSNTTALPQSFRVEATGSTGYSSSIAFAPDGTAWMSYQRFTGADLIVARFVGSGGNCDTVGAGSDAWECTTIDATDSVGGDSSLAFDNDGDAWVSYGDATNSNLEVAKYVGSGGNCDTVGAGSDAWECTTVDATDSVGQFSSLAIDSAGNPWISYNDSTNENLEIAQYVGSGGNCDSVGGGSDAWECTTVDATDNVGRHTSISFDSSGDAWVSYLDYSSSNLEVAKYVGSGGNCDTVGGGSDAWECTTVDATDAVGDDTSITIDQSGDPWVSYLDATNKNLEVARYVGSGGNCDSVGAGSDAWECTSVDVTDWVGESSSIAIDSNGDPWVSYADTTNKNLEVAKYVGSGGNCDSVGAGSDAWECITVDASGVDMTESSLAFDSNGDAWVGYRDLTNVDLMVMKFSDWSAGNGCDDNAYAAAWECGDIITSGGKGRQQDMALDNSGVPWISYYNSSSGYLDIAKYVGSGGTGCASDAWQCESIENKGYTNGDTSIAFDSGGTPWVSYNHNSTAGDLYVAHYVGSGGSCTNTAWDCDAVDTSAELDENTGGSTSIAIDHSDVAWVSYLDVATGTLKVANFVGSGGSGCNDSAWTCTTVESANDNGRGSSIAISPDDEAWVSFYSAGGTPEQELQVAKYVGSGGSGCDSSAWTCSDVFTRDLTNHTEIMFDASGKAWIGFKEAGTYHNFKVAKYVGSGGSGCYGGATDWDCLVIDSAYGMGQGSSIAMSPDGNPWFTYQDETNGFIKVAQYVGAGGSGCGSGDAQWSCRHLIGGIGGGNIHSSMAFDESGNVWITYYESSGIDLKYIKLSRSGEILLAPAQRYTNGASVSESHADMTTTTDTTNRDDADCIGGGTWNNGSFVNSSSGSGISLPDGSSTAQCTEVVFTLDLSQAEVGDNYRFMIATKDSWDSNKSVWRGLSGGGTPPELSVTDVSFISGKDNSVRLPDCDTDTDWGCAELDDGDTDDLQYPKITIDSEGNPWATWEDEVTDFMVVANYVGTGGTGCSTSAWNCESVADVGGFGGFSAVAAGADGSIWASFYDNANTALAVAKYVGSGGSCNHTDWGNANISTGSDAWDCTTVDESSPVGANVGERTDIAVDSSGNPWISYFDTTNFDLKVARYVGSGGNCDDGSLGGSDAWNCETVDSTGTSGRYSSIAISDDNDVWIMQHDHPNDSGNDNLRIVHYVGTGGNCTSEAWDCKILDDTAGEYGGIAIDHDGNPWVSYRDNAGNDLTAANYVGTGGTGCYTGVTDWNCAEVDSTVANSSAYQSSVAIAPDGNPWIVYEDSTNANLRIAKYVGSGGTGCNNSVWQCSTIESTGTVGGMPYIAFDFSGNAWIVHKDDGNNTIRLARTHRPIAPPSTDHNYRVFGRNAGSNFARYASTLGQATGNNPGECSSGTSDYYGSCALFSASGDYDTITAQANESPYWTFAQSYTSNAELPTAQWEGTSTLAPSTSGVSGDLTMQVYRYGTTNAWEDIATDTASTSCSTENCRLEGTPSGTASEYFKLKDGKYWVHYRLWQEPSTSGTITFKTDQFKAVTNQQRTRHGGYLQDGVKRPLNWR